MPSIGNWAGWRPSSAESSPVGDAAELANSPKPSEVLYPHFGITPAAIVAEARRLLATQTESATV